MEDLVANLKLAMADRIESNELDGAPTKDCRAREASRMEVMVGYPDKLRNYSKLTIAPDDLYGNVQRSGAFNVEYALQTSASRSTARSGG